MYRVTFWLNEININNTAWKVSKYGVFSGPYFTIFGLNTGKCGSRKNYVFGHFSRSVIKSWWLKISKTRARNGLFLKSGWNGQCCLNRGFGFHFCYHNVITEGVARRNSTKTLPWKIHRKSPTQLSALSKGDPNTFRLSTEQNFSGQFFPRTPQATASGTAS